MELDWRQFAGNELEKGGSVRKQRIRDPLHDLIEFGGEGLEEVCWRILESRPFQRLRRVKQLGFSDFVYPGATHSRFSHSIGVFHTARMLVGIVEKSSPHSRDNVASDAAIAAALVHDLGHGPFSHAFEDALKKIGEGRRHETRTVEILKLPEIGDALNSLRPGFAKFVSNIISREDPSSMYDAIVSSQFDADRLDYMRRDRLMSGTQHSAIDFSWLLANLRVRRVKTGQDEVGIGEVETLVVENKGLLAAETYVLGLFHLYHAVYLHKTTRGFEKIFSDLVYRIAIHAKNDSITRTGLARGHPIIRFLKDPKILENFLCLDDAIIWGALPTLANAKDAVIAELATRLVKRQKYRAHRITPQLVAKLGDRAPEAEARIREKIQALTKRLKFDQSPSVFDDMATRDPYKRTRSGGIGLDRILVETSQGNLVDLREESAVVRALKTFGEYRVYTRDDAAADKVRAIIEGELNK